VYKTRSHVEDYLACREGSRTERARTPLGAISKDLTTPRQPRSGERMSSPPRKPWVEKQNMSQAPEGA